MKLIRNSSLILLLAALLASPLTFAEDEDAGDAKVCIDTGRVRNFDGLTDDYLFIEESSDEFYLITLKHSCFGMRNARIIAFKDTMRRVCSDDNFADVVIRDMGRATSCSIDNIEKVADKAAAEALVAEREQAEDAAEAAENESD